MSFDEEAEAKIEELVDELYEGLVEDRDLRFWEGGIVQTAPTGAPNEYITVEIEGINDQSVMWRGIPASLQVGDEVLVWENPITHRREVWGGSGATTTSTTSPWQKITVAVMGGDFALLSAAIAWINALPGPVAPAATRLFAINILGGNFAEAADVTVPQYVHVGGEGEGTEIEMGAFTLIMSADTSLMDVVVESSDPTDAVRVNGVDNVILRNVSAIETDVGDCFHVLGASTNVYLYDCVALVPAAAAGFHIEGTAVVILHDCTATTTGSYNAATYGFEIEDSCSVIMNYCRAENDINFADGLHMSTSTGLFCLTRYCVFSTKDDDILTQTNNLWYHQFCEFDPDNSTIAAGSHTALPTKRFNQTLVVAEAGGDFQALSEAVAWINAQGDAAAGKLYGILMMAGNFAEGGGVTIPAYVYVIGMEGGTTIVLGANTLTISDNAGLYNVIVTSSANTAVFMNNADPWLKNVHVISSNGAGGTIFNLAGTASPKMYDCIAEATQNNLRCFYINCTGTPELYRCQVVAGGGAALIGFTAEDACTLYLEHCFAEDTTNFTTALRGEVAANATITSRHCIFRASGNDVLIQAGSTWNHIGCHFDPDNSTIAGTELPLITGNARLNDIKMLAYSWMRC